MSVVRRPRWPYPFGHAAQRNVRVSLLPDGSLDEVLFDVGDQTFGLAVISIEDERGMVSARVAGDQHELPEPLNRITVTMFVGDLAVSDPRVERGIR